MTAPMHAPADALIERALADLLATDPGAPPPAVLAALADPRNRHLLGYVAHDPFGAHVFPGDLPGRSPASFLADLDAQLADTAPIHLWAYLPTCSYRCRFCQYPVVLVGGADADQQVTRWVDWNIREARLWLDRVPGLAMAPVGEFNVFGGTPALASAGDVHRLLDFYRENFGFGPDTTIRFEGDPKSLSDGKLAALAAAGVTKVSCGVQSFDDHVLGLSGRQHAARDCVRFLRSARDLGFEWVSVDLMYGLLDQTVDSVRRDLDVVLAEQPTAVVCTKLHLRSYADTRTGVSGARPAAWQSPAHRERMTRAGHHWPTLGEQYQMREILTDGLRANGYVEHPTMYFAQAGRGPEKWKSIMVDQERQDAEVAIGLGGSSSCRRSEAITEVDWRRYAAAVDAGEVPLASATSFSPEGQEARSIRMALSTLRPLRADLHESRFPGRPLLVGPWRERFEALRERGLLTVDEAEQVITLTPAGETLVEAIINTDLAD